MKLVIFSKNQWGDRVVKRLREFYPQGQVDLAVDKDLVMPLFVDASVLVIDCDGFNMDSSVVIGIARQFKECRREGVVLVIGYAVPKTYIRDVLASKCVDDVEDKHEDPMKYIFLINKLRRREKFSWRRNCS